MFYHIKELETVAADFLKKSINKDISIVSISEDQATKIVSKLVIKNPIYRIFCTTTSSLENLNMILEMHPGLLTDEDFIYHVAAFYCNKEKATYES